MKLLPSILLGLCSAIGSASATTATMLPISNFATDGLQGWESKEFSGQTRYTLTQDQEKTVLRADSNASASALLKKIPIDLGQYPHLNWSWKIDQSLKALPELEKAGDDYAARIYVIFSTGPFFWQTRALTYVWSSRSVGTEDWPNAFTGNAHMVAVNSNRDPSGVWVNHKRNIKQDIHSYFDLDISQIEAVAIMSDSDNSNGQGTAYYANIFFSNQ